MTRASSPDVPEILLQATRALLWIQTPADARNIATDVVTALGGSVVPAADAPGDALPVDLSFGDGVPVLPQAGRDSRARALLERHLPSLVEDARRAVELGSEVLRLAGDASVDSLTRLPNRRMLGRSLGRLRTGDEVIMIDLDHFKHVNDTLGHDAGDRVLRAFGSTLRETVRATETVGRYGGEEFVVILRDKAGAARFLERFRRLWEEERPYPVTFSAGIALAGEDPGLALQAADDAMYRAKKAGRDRWESAENTGAVEETRTVEATGPVRSEPAFVAFSALTVPEGGQVVVEDAFRARLGAVDHWAGFRSLEVWADLADTSSYVMVSWWDTREAFREYMRSDDHRQSHARIPKGEHRPRPLSLRRFRIVAR